MEKNTYIKFFDEIRNSDWNTVGEINASIGEIYFTFIKKGINIPFGFALTAYAFWDYINSNQLKEAIADSLKSLDKNNFLNLNEVGEKIRKMILLGKFSEQIKKEISDSYKTLCLKYNSIADVSVRGNVVSEDAMVTGLPSQHKSFF